jgi:predicted N-acetyltransferase YhbS
LTIRIREIEGDERLTTSFVVQTYAFDPSPPDGGDVSPAHRSFLPYHAGNRTLVVEDGGTTLAAASAVPMSQNVRGVVRPMAGIAGVATHPLARRSGHVRTLLHRLLGDMRDAGHPVSVLYPFRPSFYARFGYVGLPRARTARFSPAGLAPLMRADLRGDVKWRRAGDAYDDVRALTRRLLDERHGFAVFPDYRAIALRDSNDRWVVTAHVDGEVAGALVYRIEEHAGDLSGGPLLSTGPLGRALLLRFLAHHTDQITRVVITLPHDETPELWGTDFAVETIAPVAFPNSAAPMARVLSVEALAGCAAGPGRALVEVVDDPYIAGTYLFDGEDGVLTVGRPPSGADVVLTAAGLSALVYGVLDPAELPIRGFGTVPPAAEAALRSLFPPARPYVSAEF